MVSRPFKRLSSGELEEKKRKKRLCYWCDEKFTSGHNCRMKKLYRLEVAEENFPEEGEEIDIKETKIEAETNEEVSTVISLKALTGI